MLVQLETHYYIFAMLTLSPQKLSKGKCHIYLSGMDRDVANFNEFMKCLSMDEDLTCVKSTSFITSCKIIGILASLNKSFSIST